jgi:hypothetical protein
MTTINVALIVIASVVTVVHALYNARAAHAIARLFARRARRVELVRELPPPSSHRLQPCV